MISCSTCGLSTPLKFTGRWFSLVMPIRGVNKAGYYILPGVEVEFEEGLLHGDGAFAAGRFVAGVACDDGVFHFQFGEEADLIREIMADE